MRYHAKADFTVRGRDVTVHSLMKAPSGIGRLTSDH